MCTLISVVKCNLLCILFILFVSKSYRQIEVIPMGTKCYFLVVDMFLFVMRQNMNLVFLKLAFISTSRYQDNLLNIDDPSQSDKVLLNFS